MPTPGQGNVLYLKEADKLLTELAEQSGESRSTVVRMLIRTEHENVMKVVKRRGKRTDRS